MTEIFLYISSNESIKRRMINFGSWALQCMRDHQVISGDDTYQKVIVINDRESPKVVFSEYLDTSFNSVFGVDADDIDFHDIFGQIAGQEKSVFLRLAGKFNFVPQSISNSISDFEMIPLNFPSEDTTGMW